MLPEGTGAGQEPTGTSTGTGQEPTGQQSGAGQESGQQQQGQQGPPAGPHGFDLSTIQDPALRAYLESQQRDTAEARQEAARYRTELRTAQAAEQTRARASETADQTAQREQTERNAEVDSLRTENRDLKVGGVVRSAATTAKAFNPETVWQMIRDKVQVDDKGAAINVEALMAGLKRTDAYLFQRGRATADAGGAGSGPVLSMNDRIRAARTGRSTQEE